MNRSRAPFLSVFSTPVVVLLFLASAPVSAQEAVEPAPTTEPAEPPEVTSFSGTPLLLEVSLGRPASAVAGIRLETETTQMFYDVSETAGDARPLSLMASPFLRPGIYELDIALQPAAGEAKPAAGNGDSAAGDADPAAGDAEPATYAYEVGFAEFVWGRDNFRFGNNGSYESRIGDYSDVLQSWLEARFGVVDELTHAVLVHYMYALFGKNAGRCYAFTAGQLRYRRNPDLLPSYYDTIYDAREAHKTVQRQMHFLQLDIVFDEFVAAASPPVPGAVPGTPVPASSPDAPEDTSSTGAFGPGATESQSRENLRRELERIRARIEDGEPAAVGFVGEDLHHSMLAYGYIFDRARGRVDLIVANNWKDEQSSNLASRDAEVVRIDFSVDPPAIAWLTRSGPRRRKPQRLFVVEVNEEYEHNRKLLARLVDRRLASLRGRGLRTILVEGADEAWLTDASQKVTGYKGHRTRSELEEVDMDRVQESFAFTFPKGERHTLRFVDDEGDSEAPGVRLFYVDPGSETAGARSWTLDTEEAEVTAPPEGEPWRVRLPADGPVLAQERDRGKPDEPAKEE